MLIDRRGFLRKCSAGFLARAAAGQAAAEGILVGVTDWDLRQTGAVGAVELAARIGFDGVEVSLGRKPVDGKLPLDDAGLQERYRAASSQYGIRISSSCLDVLHVHFLKNDPLGTKYLADAIPITKRLGAPLILLPMFGQGVPSSPGELDYVAGLLREAAPEAEKQGVLLALENPLSAADNIRMLERCRSAAVKVYYDTGNSANQGFDVVQEIRQLGRERIGQIHFKDGKSYLGEGKIDFRAVARALAEIRYRGFIVLETPSPSGSIESDMKRNLNYARDLIRRNLPSARWGGIKEV